MLGGPEGRIAGEAARRKELHAEEGGHRIGLEVEARRTAEEEERRTAEEEERHTAEEEAGGRTAVDGTADNGLPEAAAAAAAGNILLDAVGDTVQAAEGGIGRSLVAGAALSKFAVSKLIIVSYVSRASRGETYGRRAGGRRSCNATCWKFRPTCASRQIVVRVFDQRLQRGNWHTVSRKCTSFWERYGAAV